MKKTLVLMILAAAGFGGGLMIPQVEAKMQCDSVTYKKTADPDGGSVCNDPGEDCVMCYDVITVPG